MSGIQIISCRFGWGYHGDQRRLANLLPDWEQVLCCGAIQPESLLKPFREGYDGVMIFACQHGECHFQEGEWQCHKRVEILKETVATHGIDPKRVIMHFGNDPEGVTMPAIVREFEEMVQSL